jgi:Tol biopolymer transport system component
VLIQSGFDARLSPTGHLVYASGSSVYAVPFDVERAEVTGAPVKMVDGAATVPDSAVGGFAIASDGTLVYAAALPRTERTLAWVDRNGKEEAVAISPRAFRTVRLSPDDRRVALVIADGDREDVWIQELQSDALARVTFEGQNRDPLWTPDGERLTYTALREGVQHLTLQFARGGDVETLVSARNNLTAGAWSADGRTLVYVDSPPTDLSSIRVVARDGAWRSSPLIPRPIVESPTLSPDGRWIAFASFEGTLSQIIVQPFPGPGPRHQITTDGGGSPVWSRAGGEIFYANEGAMFAVSLETSHGFTAGKPVRLFEGRYLYSNPMSPAYDASRDGRRFLMIKPGEAERAPRELRVVVHWGEELTRRVPHAYSR